MHSGVDEHVQSLLDRLCRLNLNNEAENEEPDFVPDDDHNDKESVDDISASWDTAIRRFLQQ
ncbi:7556_t:CDS:2 [Ambispora gerdemannii]|uniref:7556_t:CDS:1 n=1 Tax=Ambispora gerdemannii TaxID=144530 RepID=A0A9N9GXT7_9GLOM|nr:7556_t:CDS:2 [Ambispora gerdemannii]